jgi:hypothetical protein
MIKIRWYKNNRYTLIIPTIYNYMAFYSLYNYGVTPVLRELLHIYVSTMHPSFFAALDCPVMYDTKKESFYKRSITQAVDEAIERHQEKYKALDSFANELNFNSLNEFSNSYFQALKNLDFEEI